MGVGLWEGGVRRQVVTNRSLLLIVSSKYYVINSYLYYFMVLFTCSNYDNFIIYKVDIYKAQRYIYKVDCYIQRTNGFFKFCSKIQWGLN